MRANRATCQLPRASPSVQYGAATSNTALSGEIGAPILRLHADSVAGKRVNTNTFALQRYTYEGSSATTRNFGGAFDYVQSITDPNNALYGTAASGVNAVLRVFTSLDAFAEAGTTVQSNNDNLYAFANGEAQGYSLIGEQFYSDPDDALSGFGSLNITVNFNPGDSVWVWAYLQTPAADGSFVDVSNGLVTAWGNAAGLVPANITSVPEPGALALFGLGLAGLGLMRRRRST